MRSGAKFSKDKRFRYVLWRVWDETNAKRLTVIGLNPSTADEEKNDATIRRCIGFAQREQCGGLIMLNLFAYRSTDPDALCELKAHNARAAKMNFLTIAEYLRAPTGPVVAAWGAHPVAQGFRAQHLLHKIGFKFRLIECFGETKGGAPKHPLRLAKTTPLRPYET